MKKIFLLIICVTTLCFNFETIAQDSIPFCPIPQEGLEYIKFSNLYELDKDSLLGRNLGLSFDSIATYRIGNKNVFIFNENSKDKVQRIFILEKSKGKSSLSYISDHVEGRGKLEKEFSGILGLMKYNDNLFIMDSERSPKTEQIRRCIKVLNLEERKIGKIIYFKDGEVFYWHKSFIKNNRLYLYLQLQTEKIDIMHYIFFFMPRGRPDKWAFYDIGNPNYYILDENYNVIEIQEIDLQQRGKEIKRL